MPKLFKIIKKYLPEVLIFIGVVLAGYNHLFPPIYQGKYNMGLPVIGDGEYITSGTLDFIALICFTLGVIILVHKLVGKKMGT